MFRGFATSRSTSVVVARWFLVAAGIVGVIWLGIWAFSGSPPGTPRPVASVPVGPSAKGTVSTPGTKQVGPATSTAPLVDKSQVEAIGERVNANVEPPIKELGSRVNTLATKHNQLKTKVDGFEARYNTFEQEVKNKPVPPSRKEIEEIIDQKMKPSKDGLPPMVPVSEFNALRDKVAALQANFTTCLPA